mgnify:CR=1 FL=1
MNRTPLEPLRAMHVLAGATAVPWQASRGGSLGRRCIAPPAAGTRADRGLRLSRPETQRGPVRPGEWRVKRSVSLVADLAAQAPTASLPHAAGARRRADGATEIVRQEPSCCHQMAR